MVNAFHITKATSIVVANGNAFPHAGPGSVIVDAGAHIISDDNGDGMNLTDKWNITVNGRVAALGLSGGQGIDLTSSTSGLVSNITVGAKGSISGTGGAIFANHAIHLINHGIISNSTGSGVVEFSGEDSTVTNSGLISAVGNALVFTSGGVHTVVNTGTINGHANSAIENSSVPGIEHITNSGHLIGDVVLGGGADFFQDFIVTRGHSKSGTVSGVVDLGEGNDLFRGGKSHETVKDSTGGDTVKLGGGNDTYLAVGSGAGQDLTDTIDGGKGIDSYDAHDATFSVFLNFASKVVTGVDITDGLHDTVTRFENAIGGSGGDVFSGNRAANHFQGRGGDDTLASGGGKDVLIGGIGLDTLIGGVGKDTLTGGADADTFRFLSVADSGAATRDVITDFSHAQGDKIDLSVIDAKKGVGDNHFHLTGNHGHHDFTHHAGELQIHTTKGTAVVSGDVNGDGEADFSIVVHGAHPILGDFIL